jgi:alcohol dehydrogenase class IV
VAVSDIVVCLAVTCHQVPNMAICDANLVDSMPTRLTAYGGLDALVHAIESYVSVCATDYTKGACYVWTSGLVHALFARAALQLFMLCSLFIRP